LIDSKATDTSLTQAFTATIYRVAMGRMIDLYVGEPPPAAIIDWCTRIADISDGWIITADNPGASIHPSTENRSRTAALDGELAEANIASLATCHIDPAARWPDEYGRLIATGDTAFVHALAARFGQAAVVHVAHDRCRLVWIG
tara:strand:+ start:426 stop:857 length:432 start_codon:yes stop_codon:yes gene_type:complete